ncbi:WGxxGxxG-CTERM domain-containing protein [Leptolyngbya sp. GB1-A1]|uniref:WGxxGxxG family protein n=1 Tax=Leptolyngbya sp. GB1-A1 TaxID=2933908 RepID=UPI0032975081
MKSSNLLKFISAGVVACTAAIAPLSLPTQAQAATTTAPVIEREGAYEDDGFDWGWLGLFGLIGLFGLAGKSSRHNTTTIQREEAPTYRDPNSTGY